MGGRYLWTDLCGAALEGALGGVLCGGARGALGKVEAARTPRGAGACMLPTALCGSRSAPRFCSCSPQLLRLLSWSHDASRLLPCLLGEAKQEEREPRTPGGAILHVRSFWDHLLDQKVPNRRGNDRMPALTAAEEQHGSRRGGGELHPARTPCEGPCGFVLQRQSREAEAPAALANTSLIANDGLKMHQLAARELVIAKKYSSCGDTNFTASSSSEK